MDFAILTKNILVGKRRQNNVVWRLNDVKTLKRRTSIQGRSDVMSSMMEFLSEKLLLVFAIIFLKVIFFKVNEWRIYQIRSLENFEFVGKRNSLLCWQKFSWFSSRQNDFSSLSLYAKTNNPRIPIHMSPVYFLFACGMFLST